MNNQIFYSFIYIRLVSYLADVWFPATAAGGNPIHSGYAATLHSRAGDVSGAIRSGIREFMRKKEKQEAIYEAALRVFARHGFGKTTVEDIARDLGMTKGNLYLYARGKRELYEKAVEHAMLRWQNRVREAVARENDARSMFTTLCTKAVEYLAMDDDFRRVLVHDPDIFPMFPVRDPFEKINKNSMAMIRYILEKGMAEGVFRKINARTTANAIFSIYKMFIIRMYIRPEGGQMRRIFEETLALLTHGLFRD